ncbi:hypothetical protein [Deinococcus aquiradiocola]|uniref:hypothetical protein n=1 Tax=Deinococcus aquiradiocola TaxID=393059 RepID=UPI00166D27D4|nr:hypothetical protein [Deinococcus aquiradiocola]
MSRAFVKEDGPTRWEPPVSTAYQLRQKGDPEVLHEGDDLLELLHWLGGRERDRYELRDRDGQLLARS